MGLNLFLDKWVRSCVDLNLTCFQRFSFHFAIAAKNLKDFPKHRYGDKNGQGAESWTIGDFGILTFSEFPFFLTSLVCHKCTESHAFQDNQQTIISSFDIFIVRVSDISTISIETHVTRNVEI